MKSIILTSGSKDNLKLFLKLAEKFGIEASFLSEEAIEDIAMVNAIKKGKTGEYVDEKIIIKDLRM
ncbi:MAG: hypothetical protein ACYC1Q_00475 [Bacteroidia bacterium]